MLITSNDRFAIFGANGMVGSAISRALTRSGFQQQLKPSRAELDLLDPIGVQQWFSKNEPTIVILAAAKVGGIYANTTYPADFLLENLKIQTNVIEGAWRAGVRRLLFLGSSCIYPKLANQPITEEELLNGYLEPTNIWYAVAKIAGIKLCQSLSIQYGFDAISLMPTNLYGPGDNYHPENSHVLPAMIRRFSEATFDGKTNVTCWGTGSPMREFLHVDELADASIFALKHWSTHLPQSPRDRFGEILHFLNVGSGEEVSIKDLANIISKGCGYKGSINWDTSKPNGTPRKKLDSSRINQLGWKSTLKLTEGIKQVAENYKQSLYE